MGWLTGRHAILAALRRGAAGTLYVVPPLHRHREVLEAARTTGVAVEQTTSETLRRNAGAAARGTALYLESSTRGNPTVELDEWLGEHGDAEAAPIVALDHVTDPHNVGAVLRSAYLLSVSLVVVPSRRSAAAGETVLRTSAGAARFVPVAYVSNLRNALERCRRAGWWIYGADAGGTPAVETEFAGRSVIVLGAEGKGLSPGLSKVIDETVTIPSREAGESGVDSFNVSVAAGILMYEFRRRHPR